MKTVWNVYADLWRGTVNAARRLGFWRIDRAVFLRNARKDDEVAAMLASAGMAEPAAEMRAVAHRWRERAALARP